MPFLILPLALIIYRHKRKYIRVEVSAAGILLYSTVSSRS
jgi:hypothetical protein